MSGNLVHANAKILCSHSAQVQTVVTQQRVFVNSQPVATIGDQFPISGCPFTVAVKPQPCTHVQWGTPAARVRVSGQPALLTSSAGVCLSAESIPQGVPNLVQYQMRVRGE